MIFIYVRMYLSSVHFDVNVDEARPSWKTQEHRWPHGNTKHTLAEASTVTPTTTAPAHRDDSHDNLLRRPLGRAQQPYFFRLGLLFLLKNTDGDTAAAAAKASADTCPTPDTHAPP